jgi:hypothetical protein
VNDEDSITITFGSTIKFKITAKTLKTLGRFDETKLKPETDKMLEAIDRVENRDMFFGEVSQVDSVKLPEIGRIPQTRTLETGIVDLESQNSAAAAN